jgi:hypothetical protein
MAFERSCAWILFSGHVLNEAMAFERSCAWILFLRSVLHGATCTYLAVNLVARPPLFLSQPIPTSRAVNLVLFEGRIHLVEKDGVWSLFRGLTSRCI